MVITVLWAAGSKRFATGVDFGYPIRTTFADAMVC